MTRQDAIDEIKNKYTIFRKENPEFDAMVSLAQSGGTTWGSLADWVHRVLRRPDLADAIWQG